jgi:hypothetical protein
LRALTLAQAQDERPRRRLSARGKLLVPTFNFERPLRAQRGEAPLERTPGEDESDAQRQVDQRGADRV